MPDLDIRQIHPLRGPNIWANSPILEAWVDLGSLKDASSDEVAGFNDRLKTWLPNMIEHRCSVGERGGFFQRLDRGTYPAHILEHVTLELQTLAGHQVGYGKARHTCVDGLYKVVVRYLDEAVAEACLRTGRELLLACYTGESFDVAGAVDHLRGIVDSNALGPGATAMVEAAKARGIPWRRLQEGKALIQFGQGSKQRRIWNSETDRTGAVAEHIARNKDLTRKALRLAGVPVPDGRGVSTADDAWDTAAHIEGPVVVKPEDADPGYSTFVNLTTEEQVRSAFEHAEKQGDGVTVEKFVPGMEHRLLVIGREMIAATRGDPAIVTGDGKQAIHELVESQLNADPRRGDRRSFLWRTINTTNWDPVVLAELEAQGYSPESVPPRGQSVIISRFSNWAEDITDDVHPTVRDHAVTAAQTAGLDICGVDVVCEDITRPLEEQGGAVVEVNANPRFFMHLRPSVGHARPVGPAVMNLLYPDGSDGRIPVIGISGTRGKTTTLKLLSHLIRREGLRLSTSSSEGVHIGERITQTDTGDRIQGAGGILLHPWTDAAICEASIEQILTDGLGFDQCQIAVVLNLGTDDLGYAYIDNLENMAKVIRCVVDIVPQTGTAVLNADDEVIAAMKEQNSGRTLYFTRDPNSVVTVAHRAIGGQVVSIQDETIVLMEGDASRALMPLNEVSMPTTGHFDFHVENVLATVGAAWAFGLSDEQIVTGLRNYEVTVG